MTGKFLSAKTRRSIIVALTTGVFLMPQVALALPEGGISSTASITTDGQTMTITSSAQDNLIKWLDFSLNSGDTVNFNDANNYMNLVTGNNVSNIYGTIKGGGGDIYLINPNGILFGAGGSVDISGTGNFYMSTAKIDSTLNSFSGVKDALNSATAAGDIDLVNLEGLKATKIEVVGKDISFVGPADNATLSPIELKATGNINMGTTGGTDTNLPANVTNANNKSVVAYKLVTSESDLKTIIKNSLGGKYMLNQNIDLGASTTSIVTGEFTGAFNGMGYTVKYTQSIENSLDNLGLFSKNSGTIKNLTLDANSDVSLSTNKNSGNVGALVGTNTTGGTIYNVHNKVEVKGTTTYANGNYVGGIAGTNQGKINYSSNSGKISRPSYSGGGVGGIAGLNSSANSTGSASAEINNSYNTGAISGRKNVGGIAGVNERNATILKSYNKGAITGEATENSGDLPNFANIGGVAGYNNGGNITYSYNEGTIIGQNYVGGIAGKSEHYTSGNATETADIKTSYNLGVVKATGTVSGNNSVDNQYIGGIVGENGGNISESFNAGNIGQETTTANNPSYNSGTYVGGIAGRNTSSGKIENAYNRGEVKAYDYVGGLVGENGGSIRYTYNVGIVERNQNNYGGIVGANTTKEGGATKTGTVSNSLYDTSKVPGGGNTAGEGKDEGQMNSSGNYSGWSMTTDGMNQSATWRMYDEPPLLMAFLTTAYVPNGTVKKYNRDKGKIASALYLNKDKIEIQGEWTQNPTLKSKLTQQVNGYNFIAIEAQDDGSGTGSGSGSGSSSGSGNWPPPSGEPSYPDNPGNNNNNNNDNNSSGSTDDGASSASSSHSSSSPASSSSSSASSSSSSSSVSGRGATSANSAVENSTVSSSETSPASSSETSSVTPSEQTDPAAVQTATATAGTVDTNTTEPVAAEIAPVTQTATTTIEQVLKNADHAESSDVTAAANVTMKDLTEASNAVTPNVQTAAESGNFTATSGIADVAAPTQAAPQATAQANQAAQNAQSANNNSAAGNSGQNGNTEGGDLDIAWVQDGMLTFINSGTRTPAAMTAQAVASEQPAANNAPSATDTTNSVATGTNATTSTMTSDNANATSATNTSNTADATNANGAANEANPSDTTNDAADANNESNDEQ